MEGPDTKNRTPKFVYALAAFITLLLLTQLTTWWAVRSISSNFDARAAHHIDGDVGHVRKQIASIETNVDAAADRVRARLNAHPKVDRAALFGILRDGIRDEPSFGGRIVTATREPVAWWGEDLPSPGDRRYQFDVTNVYIVAIRDAAPLRVEMFARIPNQGSAMEQFHGTDAWITALTFHGGFLRQAAGTRRYVIEKQGESSLWLDVATRSRDDVIAATKESGNTATAVLIAAAGLIILALGRGRIPRYAVIALIVVARIALLAVVPSTDPLDIFGYDIYASRILGPLSRSPFDLLLTAAAILAIVIVLARATRSIRPIARTFIAVVAAFGFLLIVSNLADNSRISAIPDHIVPISAAQGVLLAALLLLAFAVLRITWHESRLANAAIAVAIMLVPVVIAALLMSRRHSLAFLAITGSIFLLTLFCAANRSRSARLIAMALLAVPVVFAPVQLFERGASRRFVA